MSVTNPTKVGDGLTAYAVYTVSTKNDDPAYKKDQSIVVRRYSDFQWLRGRLSTLYPGIVLFPLPEKTVTTSPFQSDFLEHRRSGLETFLKKVVEHPVLATCEDVVMFLEEQGGSSWDQRAPWYSRGAMGTALGAMDSWFQSIGTATETWSTGAGMESVMMEEDPSYLEATEYLLLLEERLKRALKSGSEIVNSVHNLGILTGTFGENAHHLGDCEEKGAKILLGEQAGGLGQAFRQVGAAACTMRAPTEAQAERLAKRFRAPLRQSLQYVRAAKEQIDARLDALLKLQACRAKVQSKRAKLEQALHAPPTPPPIPPTTIFERLSAAVTSPTPVTVEELQRDVGLAESAVEDAQKKYDDIKSRMTNELPRVHAELERVINAAFGEAAACMKALAETHVDAWNPCFRGAPPTAPPPRERTTRTSPFILLITRVLARARTIPRLETIPRLSRRRRVCRRLVENHESIRQCATTHVVVASRIRARAPSTKRSNERVRTHSRTRASVTPTSCATNSSISSRCACFFISRKRRK